MSESISFEGVKAASANEYLEPGMWRLKIDKDNVKVEEPTGKNPYLSVRFVSESGGSVIEKFFLTKPNMPRLVYLHEAWTGKGITKIFNSFKEIGDYLKTVLTAKIVTRPMITGGKLMPDGKFYSGLPYSGFVVTDETLFEEGVFDKNSARYKSVVKIEKPNPAVANTNAAMLPATDAAVTSDDMPW